MRRAAKVVVTVSVLAAACWASISEAAFFGFPRALKSQLTQIRFQAPAMAPLAHARFCLQYAEDCRPQGGDFRRRNIALTEQRWNELMAVNREVNRDIIPQRNLGGLATERWHIAPPAGECHDYAVTKRHELLARGWSARALLLSEVVTASGEHHLVLVVRTKGVDLVLDNLNPNVRPLAMTRYQWVRMESPHNPKFWSTVTIASPPHAATSLSDTL